ncbi:radical SAM protein [Petrotoga sp. DB-2]
MLNLRLSYATAVELGLKKGKIDFPNYTAYLMIGEKCLFNCAYCAQARNAQSNADLLSRIKWPEMSLDTFKSIFNPTKFKRICIQVVSSLDYWIELNELLSFLKEKEIPISVSIRPRNIEEVRTLFKKYNVDRVGIAIDVANKDLFSKIRGGKYEFYENMLKNVSTDFPNRITTHIIVGLGETDENIVDFLLKMKKFKILVSLFSFTPIKGTKLENLLSPSLSRYRKIQIAREIILQHDVEKADFLFDSKGNLQKLPEVKVDIEEAKKTSGCPWCTRPFYNEKPTEEPYNIPIPRHINL